jgi:hypothetical protein
VDLRRAQARGEHFVEVGAGHPARAGGGERVAGAAAAVGEHLGAGTARDFRRRRPGYPGPFAEVGGDVVELLAGDDVARHHDGVAPLIRPRELHLGLDDPFDRVAVLADFAGGGEGVVEVGADLRRGPRLREGVAGAAFLHEEGPAAGGVGGRGAAPGHRREHRTKGGEEQQRADEFQMHWAGHIGRSRPESICRTDPKASCGAGAFE